MRISGGSEPPICYQSDSQRYVRLRPQQVPWVRRNTGVEKTAENPSASDPTPDQENPDGSNSPSGSECSFESSSTEEQNKVEHADVLETGVLCGRSRPSSLSREAGDVSMTDHPSNGRRIDVDESVRPHHVSPPSGPSKNYAPVSRPQHAEGPPRVEIRSFNPRTSLLQRRPRNRGTTSTSLPTTLSVEVKLPDCPIGAIELLTFFPNHTQWPLAGLRLHANDWTFLEIAAVVLHARGKLTAAALHNRRAALRHQVSRNGKEHFRDDEFTLTWWKRRGLLEPHSRYDAAEYKPRSNINASSLRDASLLACAQGVRNWPTGEDCGILTQCVEMARDLGDATLMISEVGAMAEQCGFHQPAEAATGQWDRGAMKRVAAMLKTYRLDSQMS